MASFWFFMFHINFLMLCINSKFLLQVYASQFKNVTDRLALLAFKNAITMDPNGVFNTWNTSLHHCQWQGISCSRKHNERVTVVDLHSQGLVGSLSAHIGNLSFLRVIYLWNNSFHGQIPPEIGKLFRLSILYLNNNSFHGEIPANVTGCRNLREMNLIDNNLTGKLPVELSSLSNLEGLGLSKNHFKGKIPPCFGNLSSLIILSMSQAMLEGSIPNDLGRLTRLKYLLIGINNLTGTIPSSIYNLSSLVRFSVTANSLEGNLPADVGFTLPNIQQLAMAGNRFTGNIPISLSNASQLQMIALPGNGFSGPVPQELGRLVNLSSINLSSNMLGTRGGNDLRFISYLINCTKLEMLFLGDNLLKGRLPNSIANLSTNIRQLQLGQNQIYGTIPSGIQNLVNLYSLEFQYMILDGNIPPTIGNLRNMVGFYMNRNKLTGQIPPTLVNLTVLYEIDLSFNKLIGKIPSSLGNCSQLHWLNLSGNDLSGTLPVSLFGIPSILLIDLSHNSLTGSMPPDVGNLKLVEALDVSHNKLSGSIPSTLGSCLSLATICMNGNFFQGTIPEELSALRGLNELDLSHNNLSGMLPENLSRLPFLQILNLSFNDLEGEVPKTGNFRNASVLSLSGNRKLCGGIPELKLPVCAIPHSNRRGMSLALKLIILLIAVAFCFALVVGFFILCHKRNKSKKKLASASLENQFIKISYQELLRATDGFSNANLIGFGSYGSVYKGLLHQSQSFIAVKVFNLQQRGASKSFIHECKALRNIRHRNLLKIFSVCSSADHQGNDFQALIYEFIPRGSLDKWLYPEVTKDDYGFSTLNLIQRLNIVIDVACALEYLHCDCQPAIVHSDIKPSNVLLDDDMVAHVGDFGLARVLSTVSSDAQDDQSNSIIKGSIGYIAPEYGMGEGASIQGDVYSFGILIMEIFTTRKPTDGMFQGDLNLHNFTVMALPERVMDIVDPQLLFEDNEAGRMQLCLISVLRVGLSCSVEIPRDRMEIRNVVRELHLIKEAYEREAYVQPAMKISNFKN